jgi:hypothetical protein
MTQEYFDMKPKSGHMMRNLSAFEITKRDIPEPEWIIHGILRSGGAAMVYGPPGIGKTWLTETLAILAAHGRGLSIADGGLRAGDHDYGLNVLVFDGEMIEYDIKEMINRLSRDCNLGDRVEETLKNIHYYLKAGQPPLSGFIDLANPEDKETIIDHALLNGIELVVFDNLSTLSSSLRDENDSVCWNPLNDLIVGLKAVGIASLLVHHSNRGYSGEYRGSSNLMATLETVVQLGEVEKAEGIRMKVNFQKTRNAGMNILNDKILALPLTGPWRMEAGRDIQTTIDMLRSGRYKNQTELAGALSITQGQVSRRLKDAISAKLISMDEIKRCYKGLVSRDIEIETEEVTIREPSLNDETWNPPKEYAPVSPRCPVLGPNGEMTI